MVNLVIKSLTYFNNKPKIFSNTSINLPTYNLGLSIHISAHWGIILYIITPIWFWLGLTPSLNESDRGIKDKRITGWTRISPGYEHKTRALNLKTLKNFHKPSDNQRVIEHYRYIFIKIRYKLCMRGWLHAPWLNKV